MPRLGFFFAMLAFTAQAWAADSTSAPDPSNTGALRTLFHSAAEREQLDRLRRGEPPGEAAAPKRAAPHAVTGFVKRSDGRGTVWVDGQPVTSADAQRLADPAKVHDPTHGNRAIEIKPSR